MHLLLGAPRTPPGADWHYNSFLKPPLPAFSSPDRMSSVESWTMFHPTSPRTRSIPNRIPQAFKSPSVTVIDLTGNGLSPSEQQTTGPFTSDAWHPQARLSDQGIGELVPGSRRATFTGRVVYLYDKKFESGMPKAAKGCLKLLLKDAQAVTLVASS